MPLVTATPRGNKNGQVWTEFVDSVGTTSVTYSYSSIQELLSIRNTGQSAITVTVGGTSQTVQPGAKWDYVTDFSSFDIVSTGGVQSFEARADKKGSAFDSPEGKYIVGLGSGNFAYNTDSALRGWRLAKARLDSGIQETINLNVLGDSISEGQAGGTVSIANYQRGYVNLIRQNFLAKYGDVGEGMIPNQYPYTAATTKWTYAGTWQTFSGNGLFYGNSGTKVSVTASSTASLTFTGTGVTILFEGGTSGGGVSISVDGGSAQTLSTNRATDGVVVEHVITGLAAGTHTVVITVTSSKISLLGAYEIKGTKGVRVNTLAVSGLKVNSVARTFNSEACIGYWTPKLSIISFLANDYNTQTDLSSFRTDWQATIKKAKQYGDVLVTSLGGIYDSNGAIPMSAYRDIVFQLAMDNNCAFLDIAKRWGDTYATANNSGYLVDNVHPKPEGHQDAANAILALIA